MNYFENLSSLLESMVSLHNKRAQFLDNYMKFIQVKIDIQTMRELTQNGAITNCILTLHAPFVGRFTYDLCNDGLGL